MCFAKLIKLESYPDLPIKCAPIGTLLLMGIEIAGFPVKLDCTVKTS